MQQVLTLGWAHCAEGVTGKRANEVTHILDRLLNIVALTGSGVHEPRPALPDSPPPPLPAALPELVPAVIALEPTASAAGAAHTRVEPVQTERPPLPSPPADDDMAPALSGCCAPQARRPSHICTAGSKYAVRMLT